MTLILTGLSLSIPYTSEVKAEEVKAEEVVVEVVEINWTPEMIEEEIRTTFIEEPNTAVAVAKAEGGLVEERQSDYHKNGKREESFCAFQIHAPSWMKRAESLGYGDYKTNVESCIKMAKYIYDHTGKNFNQWSAYRDGKHKKHL